MHSPKSKNRIGCIEPLCFYLMSFSNTNKIIPYVPLFDNNFPKYFLGNEVSFGKDDN
jgi:hypothetical protein